MTTPATPVQSSQRDHRRRCERIIGQALLEGADEAAVDRYLRDVCLVQAPDKLRLKVQGRNKSPRLGELDWKAFGGRDPFRALFGLQPLQSDAVQPEPFEMPPACELAEAEAIVRQWFGDKYDMDALHLVLAAAAVNQLTGDPLWPLLVSGPGFTKTETVSTLGGAGATITSTISSEGALLSGSGKKDAAPNATGGLLKKLGQSGVLVLKDMTTILSMHHDSRATLLAALREIHDGKWERNLGTDGGKTLTWTGRLILVGAVTSAWDSHHSVIASMGDRFVTLRIDSADTDARLFAGQRSLANLGHEVQMREALAKAVGGVLHTLKKFDDLSSDEHDELLSLANFVTLCRTAVEYDWHGRVEMAHMPEAPTRFVKQLAQVMRGALSIGLDRDEASALALRVAGDSMPPMRLEILQLLAKNPAGLTTKETAHTLDQPFEPVDKQLQSLHSLRALSRIERPTGKTTKDGTPKHVWVYTLAIDMPCKLKTAAVHKNPVVPKNSAVPMAPTDQDLPLDEVDEVDDEEPPF